MISQPDDPLRPHSHDPNLETPAGDGALLIQVLDGEAQTISVAQLRTLPRRLVPRHKIVSTGHGATGPFTFAGAALLDVVTSFAGRPSGAFSVAVIAADGFGNRIASLELEQPSPTGPILLAYEKDGRSLTREDGLVRLIVPSETDEALRQVKWVARIVIAPAA